MKRILSIALCLVMIVTLAVPAAAVTKEATMVGMIVSPPIGIPEGAPSISPENTRADQEIIIPLLKDGFKDKDGADITWDDNQPDLGPNKYQMSYNNIKPYLRFYRGSEVVRDWEIVNYDPTPSVRAQSAIRIRFVEDFVSTEEFNYEFAVYLSFHGDRIDMNLAYSGTIFNEIIDIYRNDYVNLEHGNVAKCYFSADEVKVGLGNGVNLYSDMVYNEKYYGIAKHYDNEAQTLIARSYPEIDEIYELKTVNLKIHGDLIEFTQYENDPHYVYNMRGEYLGVTTDRLPYATKYYLSETFITIDVDKDALEKELQSQYPEPFRSGAVEKFAQGLAEDQEAE